MYSVLLNCKSAVSIRTVLRIPPVVAQWDRVFLVFPIVVINGMIFLLILRVATNIWMLLSAHGTESSNINWL